MAAGCAEGKLKGTKVLGTRRTRERCRFAGWDKEKRDCKNTPGIKIAGGQMTEEVRV